MKWREQDEYGQKLVKISKLNSGRAFIEQVENELVNMYRCLRK